MLLHFIVVDVHESTLFLAQEYDDGRKLDVVTADLGIRAHTDLQAMSKGCLRANRLLDGSFQRQVDPLSVESTPL
jgi:hypothetical protein